MVFDRSAGPSVTPLLRYIDSSPSPYHAIEAALAMLAAAGFTRLEEGEAWALEPGKSYMAVRGGKTLVAWRQGTAHPAEAGFRLVGAHSDSPVLKLRPRPDMDARGLKYLTTEVYGGPLLNTWFDRDLKLAGALYCGEDKLERVLVDLPGLNLRTVSLAIHLRKDKGSDTFTLDREKDLAVVAGAGKESAFDLVRSALASQLDRDPGPVISFDLSLGDAAPATRIGAEGELISAPRLDNLFSCYAALAALLAAPAAMPFTTGAVIYDAEEIGSQTYGGARSNFAEGVLSRIVAASGASPEDVWRAKARSLIVSADMAHAEHPAFASATDPGHVPEINKGLAIKNGPMGNYAVGPAAEAWFELVCRKVGLTLQRFRYRCDHGRGSSIGPIVTTALGIEGIDVGAPMLAMHSARELAGAADIDHAIAAFTAFYSSEEPLPF